VRALTLARRRDEEAVGLDLVVVRRHSRDVRRWRVYDRTVLVFAVILLFANAIFNAIAWPRFYPRIAADPRARDADGRRTAFYTVHVVLIVIALVLAAASAITGVVILL
jgi:hypothetical protein